MAFLEYSVEPVTMDSDLALLTSYYRVPLGPEA
jgi:hypothetical protein